MKIEIKNKYGNDIIIDNVTKIRKCREVLKVYYICNQGHEIYTNVHNVIIDGYKLTV